MTVPVYHGLLVVDKPGGLTSRAVVDRALGWFPRRTRVGHTGTLDPLATGVLVLCVGAATRLAEYVQDMGKTYRSGLLLGARSDSDDADGTVEAVAVEQVPDLAAVERCLAGFVGEIEQVPPAFSAAKVTGRRAYDLARRGEKVELRPRRVRIDAIDVLAYDYPRLQVEVRCGKGTYIRSLARDLGERLGCGALVETLRRTRVGLFAAEGAVSLDATANVARAALLPLAAALTDLPRVEVTTDEAARLRAGQAIRLVPADTNTEASEVAVFGPAGEVIAVAALDPDRRLMPNKVLPDLRAAGTG